MVEFIKIFYVSVRVIVLDEINVGWISKANNYVNLKLTNKCLTRKKYRYTVMFVELRVGGFVTEST